LVDCSYVIDGIERHIRMSASYSRKDRLFPADEKLFSTNPLSLAHGAAGVVYALSRMSDDFPQQAVEWVLEHEVTDDEY